jgi:hypothetical protein
VKKFMSGLKKMARSKMVAIGAPTATLEKTNPVEDSKEVKELIQNVYLLQKLRR